MRSIPLLCLLVMLTGSISIHTMAQDPSAIADFESTEKGVLLPRMTFTEREAIEMPATGLLVFQLDSISGVYCNIGTDSEPDWVNMTVLAKTLSDADLDTKIEVERTPDSDKIDLSIGGSLKYSLSANSDFVPTLQVFDELYNLNIGEEAGLNTFNTNSTNGRDNIFVGYRAGRDNEIGTENVAIGNEALKTNITGFWNTAVGFESLMSNISNSNSGFGYHTLRANVDGTGNTAIGRSSMASNIDGDFNTAVGEKTLNSIAVSSGNNDNDNNSVLGYLTLNRATQAARNVAIGSYAGANDTVSIQNVFIGYGAGGGTLPFPSYLTAKQRNVFVGYEAGAFNRGSDNVFLGYQAGKNDTTTFDKLYIANSDTDVPLIWGDFVERRIGIDRIADTFALEVNGEASKSSGGDWMTNSDERLKKNIQTLDGKHMLSKLLELKGVTFEWDDPRKHNLRPKKMQYGLIAQNVKKEFPELVEKDSDGYLLTSYSTYDAMYIEVIRHLNNRIKELESFIGHKDNKIQQMEAKQADLDARLSALEELLRG